MLPKAQSSDTEKYCTTSTKAYELDYISYIDKLKYHVEERGKARQGSVHVWIHLYKSQSQANFIPVL